MIIVILWILIGIIMCTAYKVQVERRGEKLEDYWIIFFLYVLIWPLATLVYLFTKFVLEPLEKLISNLIDNNSKEKGGRDETTKL